MTSLVTVGIPFYSGSKLEQLKAAIDSIVNQTLYPDEIHLIQNGPASEELIQLIQGYVKCYPNISHLVIEHNTGPAYAINFSILSTTSKYYARMDSDDIAYPQRLEKQIQFLETHPEINILGTWAQEFENDPNTEQGFLRKVPIEFSEMEKFFHYRNPFIHPSIVFRRTIFAMIGLYNPKFRLEEDLELWSRVFINKVLVANLSEPLIYYRFSGSVQRRASAIRYNVKARYQFNTWSLRLNVLKALAILLRIMPNSAQVWAYKNLRS